MIPAENKWKILSPDAIQAELGDFMDWFLCGGLSLDVYLGEKTREHGDTDIGIFSQDLAKCLEKISLKRVFVAHGTLTPIKEWDKSKGFYNLWVADESGENWIFQIMICETDGKMVKYRRNSEISWPIEAHSIKIGKLKILNPLITFLFKANQKTLPMKDCADISALIRHNSGIKKDCLK